MSKPIIAIAGRPNVGKSTLFNRLVRKRSAIVEDTPGVTRDRLYGNSEWGNRIFSVIDTGGLQEGEVYEGINKQVEYALKEADIIFCIFDAREGVTATDKELVSYFRKIGKPVFYLANKVDQAPESFDLADFHILGIPRIFSISAEHGLGIGDLMEEAKNFFPGEEESPEDEKRIRLAIIGRPNVGKSSLINRILRQDRLIVSASPGTTRNPIDTYFTYKRWSYVAVDTAGIRRKGKVRDFVEKISVIKALKSLQRCHVALVLIDAVEGITDQDLHIGGYAHQESRAVVIVANKWDLLPKGKKKVFTQSIRDRFKYLSYAPVIFTSTVTGEGIGRIFQVLPRVFESFTRRVQTAHLNTVLEKIVQSHPPGLYRGKRPRFYYMTQPSVKPPTFILFTNQPKGLHFSYLRYLENQLRREFDFFGTSIVIKPKARSKALK
jgi:GTP-binding protein